jgi:hypothetical protein
MVATEEISRRFLLEIYITHYIRVFAQSDISEIDPRVRKFTAWIWEISEIYLSIPTRLGNLISEICEIKTVYISEKYGFQN